MFKYNSGIDDIVITKLIVFLAENIFFVLILFLIVWIADAVAKEEYTKYYMK